jgi:uncharacterized membrane protein YeaQ/YmgE (transglycosylase-associated protein family)
MELIAFLLIGLFAGILAKAVMPGEDKEPSGWLMTILLGIGGAIVGGLLAGLLGIHAYGFIGKVLVAAFGAVVIIAVGRAMSRRHS